MSYTLKVNIIIAVIIFCFSVKTSAIVESSRVSLTENTYFSANGKKSERLKKYMNFFKPYGDNRSPLYILGIIAFLIALFFFIIYTLPAGSIAFFTIPFKNALLDTIFWGLIALLLLGIGSSNCSTC
jgi:ABC-type multidrug transport system permease subunit